MQQTAGTASRRKKRLRHEGLREVDRLMMEVCVAELVHLAAKASITPTPATPV